MITPLEIRSSSSVSIVSSESDNNSDELDEVDSFVLRDFNNIRNGPISESHYPSGSQDVYDVDQESSLSEIDLCDTDLSDVEIHEISESRPTDWSTTDIHPVIMQPTGFQDQDIVERMLGLRMNGSFFSEAHQSNVFARILEQVRSQALIINRLSSYHIESVPRISPSAVLAKLATHRLKNKAEAELLGSCPICLETYKPRMSVRILPGCKHLVHKPCMDKWISQSHKYTCPLDNLAIDVSETATSASAVEIAEAAFPANRRGNIRRNTGTQRRSDRIRRRIE